MQTLIVYDSMPCTFWTASS